MGRGEPPHAKHVLLLRSASGCKVAGREQSSELAQRAEQSWQQPSPALQCLCGSLHSCFAWPVPPEWAQVITTS